jgi:hypothetical protein
MKIQGNGRILSILKIGLQDVCFFTPKIDLAAQNDELIFYLQTENRNPNFLLVCQLQGATPSDGEP